MYAQMEKPKENRSRAVGNSVVQKKKTTHNIGFVDNRQNENSIRNHRIVDSSNEKIKIAETLEHNQINLAEHSAVQRAIGPHASIKKGDAITFECIVNPTKVTVRFVAGETSYVKELTKTQYYTNDDEVETNALIQEIINKVNIYVNVPGGSKNAQKRKDKSANVKTSMVSLENTLKDRGTTRHSEKLNTNAINEADLLKVHLESNKSIPSDFIKQLIDEVKTGAQLSDIAYTPTVPEMNAAITLWQSFVPGADPVLTNPHVPGGTNPIEAKERKEFGVTWILNNKNFIIDRKMIDANGEINRTVNIHVTPVGFKKKSIKPK